MGCDVHQHRPDILAANERRLHPCAHRHAQVRIDFLVRRLAGMLAARRRVPPACAAHAVQVDLLTVMVGNLALKSRALAAIDTATRRATLL